MKKKRRKPAPRHKQTRLPLVRTWPSEDATILDVRHPSPLFLGDDREDLLCGSCRTPLAQGVSMASFRSMFNASVQLLVRCPKCHSLSTVGTSDRQL
ncbi:MAG TPA: hypothetical protein VEU32_05655 [Burkholderiales bacterium]|nr:hypothetical protein [Burkholderiales bacterium]